MGYFLLVYDYTPDFMERRAPFRAEHLARAKAAAERGELVFGGAFADEPAGGALLFQGDDPGAAHAFAEGDPYVLHEIVTGWRVREWTIVVGAGLADPG